MMSVGLGLKRFPETAKVKNAKARMEEFKARQQDEEANRERKKARKEAKKDGGGKASDEAQDGSGSRRSMPKADLEGDVAGSGVSAAKEDVEMQEDKSKEGPARYHRGLDMSDPVAMGRAAKLSRERRELIEAQKRQQEESDNKRAKTEPSEEEVREARRKEHEAAEPSQFLWRPSPPVLP